MLGFAIFVFIFVMAFLIVGTIAVLAGFSPPGVSETGTVLGVASSIIFPGILAIFTTRLSIGFLLKKIGDVRFRLPRVFGTCILIGYIIAWTLGVPAVQSYRSSDH